MNRKVVFIADFFANHVLGGGELNNDELINMLREKGYDVVEAQSHLVGTDFINDNVGSFFIISNFANLSWKCRVQLRETDYIIYEHDHKYLESRNPALYKDFKAPSSKIINYSFYKNAKAVLCQSKFHKDILCKNLSLDNVVNLGGNIWSKKVLQDIRELSKNKKQNKYSILNSAIEHKNTTKTVQYCLNKNIKYDLIASNNYNEFLKMLSLNQKFIFLPKTPETLSRVVVEARMLGCSVSTNDLVGATSEEWFALKGPDLIDRMLKKRSDILSIVEGFLNTKDTKPERPLVSILSTFHKAEKFIENFMKNITSQTLFDKCELIIIDAKSPGKEQEVVQEYCKKYKNIRYLRIEEKLLPTPCFNMAIKMANAKYLTFAFTDDVKKEDCIETLYNEIKKDTNVSLVYGDVLQTNKENDTFENNHSDGTLMLHSTYEFSKENMIKCLPGPMPLWGIEIHEKCGFFDHESCNYADDWEMWLRAVNSGLVFKKVSKVVGLYLQGGRSQQDNPSQRKEEAEIFYKYSHLFGSNYYKFEPYFKQFLGK